MLLMAVSTVANSKVDDVTSTPILEGVVATVTPELEGDVANVLDPKGALDEEEAPLMALD